MNFLQSLFPGMYNKVRNAFGYTTYSASTEFNDSYRTKQKLNAVLQSPALLKVICLQCDLFSLGEIYVDKKGVDGKTENIPNDAFIAFMKSPNPFQSKQQFLWDFMFWLMLGTDYCLSNSKVLDAATIMYMLDPSKIEWPQSMEKTKDHMIFSQQTLAEIKKTSITYRYEDGTTFDFILDRMIVTNDLTNGIGNFYKGPNRIDALYKIISNADQSLDSKNVNTRYLRKFLVGAQRDSKTVGLSQTEVEDIRENMDKKDVFPLMTMAEIRRFVQSISETGLDQSYLADYFLIGNMYGIPRDVLEAYVSATYENQEKARMAHISYTLQPKGNDWMNAFEKFFGYDKEGKNIYISWDHLPFAQVFEKDRADKEKVKIESFKSLTALGVSADEANEYLDTDFHPNAAAATPSEQVQVNVYQGGNAK